MRIRRATSVLAAFLLGIALGGGQALAAAEGQDDLDKAVQAKLRVKSAADLAEVLRLCESALKKGLDEDSARFANKLMASTFARRGALLGRSMTDSLSPNGRWRELRRAALEDLEKAVKLDGQHLESLLQIAQLNLLPEGDRKRAADAIEEVLQRAKDEPALRVRALMLRANSRKDAADKLADLSEAIRLAPKDPGLLEAKAMVLARMKRFDEALATLEQLRKLEPKSAGPLFERARLLLLKDDLPAALKSLDEACTLAPTSAEALLMRASVLQEMNQSEKALADVDRALKLQPGLEIAKRLRVAILAGGGKFGEAIAEMEGLLKSRPDDEENQLQLAMLYSADERPAKAASIYSKLLARKPDHFAALRGRGDAFLGLGKHAEAIADYENAYRLRPKDSALLNNFAWVLATSPVDALRNGKRARELAEEACKLTDHKQGHILSTLAAACAELGDFDSALKWSQKAIEIGRDDQKEALRKELESYKARKPFRELKNEDKDRGPAKPEPPAKQSPAGKPKAKPKPVAGPVI